MSHKFNTTFKQIRRSPYQSLGAVFMTTITFFVISVFALVGIGGHSMLTFFESRPQVTAFLKDSSTVADSEALKNLLSDKVTIESVRYISKEEALEIYREQNADNPLLLEMVTADILPASLEVSVKNVKDLEVVANIMQANQQVEEVVFQKEIIDTLRKWVGGVRLAGIVLSSFLVFASLATIIMILSLKFSAKRAEINTLSLLGATKWYIRGPFVIEGVVYAISGSILGWGLSYLSLLYLTPNLVSFFGDIRILPVPVWIMLSLLGAEAFLATTIGALASLVASRRYGR